MKERVDERETIIVTGDEEKARALDDPLIGTVLDNKYLIDQFIGAGGFSRVYKATHLQLKKTFAIKLLHEQFASDQEKCQRLTREARTTSSLCHPNIVGLHDFVCPANSKPYLVMDYVEGSSLADVLKSGRHFTIEECIQIASQACTALEAAHSQNIIHRDLKPANIMLVDDPESKQITVRLLDFGLAKVLQSEGDSLIARTKTGEVLGTPAYMSPEQCQGHQLDAGSDIYSLGCVFYELLTGVKAFSAETPLAMMLQHLNNMPRPFAAAAPQQQIPVALETAVFKALAKKREDRYRNAREFKDALVAAGDAGKGSIMSFAGLIKSRLKATRIDRRFLVITVLCLGVIAGAGIAAFHFQKPDWRQLYNEVHNMDYTRQAAGLRQVLIEARAAHASPLELASISGELATRILQVEKNYEGAYQVTEDSVKLLRETHERKDAEAAAALLHFFASHLLEDNPGMAIKVAKESVDLGGELRGVPSGVVSDDLTTLGMAYYNARDFKNAENEFQKALSMQLKISPKATPEEARIRWCLCKAYLIQNRQADAQQMYEKCLAIETDSERRSRLQLEYNGLKFSQDRFELMK